MTTGRDGNVWVTEAAGAVARITPSGTVTSFPVTESPGPIVAGPDGNLWTIESGVQQLVAKLTTAGVVTEYPCPQCGSVGKMAAGPDGDVWFASSQDCTIGKVAPTGVATTYVLPSCDGVTGIAAGPDGNIWVGGYSFGLPGDGEIFRINRHFASLAVFLTPLAPPLDPIPSNLTAGPDGNMWYTSGANRIGRITMSGAITEYPVPATNSAPDDIVSGPGRNLWFTEKYGTKVAKIDPATGAITEIHISAPESQPDRITVGSDGKLWFTEGRPSQVANFDPASIVAPPGPCMVVTKNTTLTHDVGPCSGDGIDVTGSGVVVDLNGHKVRGAARRQGDFAGIHLLGTSRVTVKNGTVSGFDAGVSVESGVENTLTGLTVHGNHGFADPASTFGDGIALFHASSTKITHNAVYDNGIFDGISVLGLGSDLNVIEANSVYRNTNDMVGDQPGGGRGVVVAAFLEAEDPGRGQSVVGNNVIANNIHDNASAGISSQANIDARILNNLVTNDGFRDSDGNGIGFIHFVFSTPDLQDTVAGNVVSHIQGDGITTNGNGSYIHNNTATGTVGGNDYVDQNGDCTHNTWRNNVWGPARTYPDCIQASGHQVGGTPGAPPGSSMLTPTKPVADPSTQTSARYHRS